MRRQIAMAVPMFLACCTTQVKEAGSGLGNVRATSFEFNRVEFKVGRPLVDDLIVDVLREPSSEQIRLLKENSDALKETRGLGAEVIGFVDGKECVQAACLELSMRRATYVYDWLVEQGVPPSKLKGPASGGLTGRLEMVQLRTAGRLIVVFN
ncbi:OmpA family protein [Lysobacter antibioticus]|uniref:OmpA family protein n=1 Tax=Lysobacter antibioticus TaxID=84531 RepID=UPI0009E6B434|nr:OmpA family protein [Lysobacter antibioticus]